jgi:hypothetical protein
MSWHEGRIEKRIQLAVPLELFGPEDPAGSERTIAENVCAHGARVLARRVRQPNERLMVSSWRVMCEPRRGSFIVSGCSMGVLVLDYSSREWTPISFRLFDGGHRIRSENIPVGVRRCT